MRGCARDGVQSQPRAARSLRFVVGSRRAFLAKHCSTPGLVAWPARNSCVTMPSRFGMAKPLDGRDHLRQAGCLLQCSMTLLTSDAVWQFSR